MRVQFSLPDITEAEIAAVNRVLRSGWITTGAETEKFGQQIAQFCGTEQAVCLSSATAALEMTLRTMGIGPGDEVITTAYTYTASCSCICHVGATPVLVDTLPGSYDMDPAKVEAAITEKTKAIICVDLAGIIYKYYEQIYQIVELKKGLFCPKNDKQEALGRIVVIADSAHAFGASRGGRMSGQIADFTCFSFHAVKNLTTAEGGAVTWAEQVCKAGLESSRLHTDYMLFSLHGQSRDAYSKMEDGNWEYDVIAPYYKCNMTDIMAALGLAQLARYPKILEKRRKTIERYHAAFIGLPVEMAEHFGADFCSNGHLYLVRLMGKSRAERNEIIRILAEKGISTNVHYKPLPMLSAYKNMGFDIQDFPNAYHQFENEITLPLHSCLTEEQISYVIKEFQNVF